MFTIAFWRTTAELVAVAFLSTFTGAFTIQSGTLTLRGLEAAGIAGAVAAVYVLAKQLGAVQAANATPKVAVPVPAAKVVK
jgi:hypothetical protein